MNHPSIGQEPIDYLETVRVGTKNITIVEEFIKF